MLSQSTRLSSLESDYFSYSCAHDLKEPLRILSMFIQLLCVRNAGSYDDVSLDYVQRIFRSVHRMDSLIDNIFIYSSVLHDKEEYCAVDLRNVIETIQNDLDLLLYDVDGKIEMNDLPILLAQPTQMYQLFTNLISNAIKFRSKNPLRIDIKALDCHTYWEISINDNGIGLDENEHQTIFKAFKRLHCKKDYEGTGIGLAICQRIVEAHDGTIGVQSNPTGGCLFKVCLPKTAYSK